MNKSLGLGSPSLMKAGHRAEMAGLVPMATRSTAVQQLFWTELRGRADTRPFYPLLPPPKERLLIDQMTE